MFYRQEDGAPVALADKCAHRHAPLSAGRLVGDDIECPYHGLTYNSGGERVRVPGQSTIPPGCRVRPTAERYQWIWMGDPALADPESIEDFHWMDAPDWRAKGELMHVQANYKPLVENLLDLSHLTFIHKTTLGASAETPMKFERGDNRVTVTRNGFARAALLQQGRRIPGRRTRGSLAAYNLDAPGLRQAGHRGGESRHRSDRRKPVAELHDAQPQRHRPGDGKDDPLFLGAGARFPTNRGSPISLCRTFAKPSSKTSGSTAFSRKTCGATPPRVDINHGGGGLQAMLIDAESRPRAARAAE